eukprot:1336804-Prorocentrum_lima.AAC.1
MEVTLLTARAPLKIPSTAGTASCFSPDQPPDHLHSRTPNASEDGLAPEGHQPAAQESVAHNRRGPEVAGFAGGAGAHSWRG